MAVTTYSDSVDEMTQQVVLRIDGQLYGIGIGSVREMLELPLITNLPGDTEELRGVINLRGQIITVLDLRKELGVSVSGGGVQHLCDMLDERRKDHENWLSALEKSVEEGVAFTGQTDPHLCAFGRWYDSFEHRDRQVMNSVRRFDVPHKRIHSLAAETQDMLGQGRGEDARQLIHATRDSELQEMISLFELTKATLREGQREVAVVLEYQGSSFAVCVDNVESVDWLHEQQSDDLPDALFSDQPLATRVAIRKSGEKNVLVALLEIEVLAQSFWKKTDEELSCASSA